MTINYKPNTFTFTFMHRSRGRHMLMLRIQEMTSIYNSDALSHPYNGSGLGTYMFS